MYEALRVLITAYIKSVVTIDVFDANLTFIAPDSYACFYILQEEHISPHSNLIDTYKDTPSDTKKFVFKQSKYIKVRVDFRGTNAITNMALFDASFLKEIQRDILKTAGFGYMGSSPILPIQNLRDVKAKAGMTTTVTLFSSQTITDESQIITSIPIVVDPTLP